MVGRRGWLTRGRARCEELKNLYYPKGLYPGPRQRYLDSIERCLGPKSRVLDAGCGGDWDISQYLYAPGRTVVGIDLAPPLQRTPGTDGVRGTLEHLPFADASFDLVVSMSVLEHLRDPLSSLSELARVLRPGGRLLVQAPNLLDYVSVISRLTPFRVHEWVLYNLVGRAMGTVFPTFYRANTAGALTRLLLRTGLIPVRIQLFNQYPAYLMFSPLAFRFGTFYERITSRFARLAPFRGWLLAEAERGEVPGSPPPTPDGRR